MKTLLVLARIIAVGFLWSIVFIEGVRVIMLENWRFDIFWPTHWAFAWNLWLSGWVIDTAKEWAFVLILVAFLPLWLTGWIALSLLPWETWIYKALLLPRYLFRRLFNPLALVTAKTPVVIKKRSYKEIRPTGPRTPIYDYGDTESELSEKAVKQPVPTQSALQKSTAVTPPASRVNDNPLKKRVTQDRETFNHALFNMDDDEDDDFDLDFDSVDQSTDGKSTSKGHATDLSEYMDDTRPLAPNDEQATDRRPPRDDRDRRRSDTRGDTRGDNRNADKGNDRRNNDRRSTDDRRDERRNNDRRAADDNRDDRRNNDRRSTDERRKSDDGQPRLNNPVADILAQKGYDVIADVTIRKTFVDFIGVAEDKILLCVIDKETGDWLADEERFNNEEPLWFSESSHRISPVRKADIARQALSDKLSDGGFDLEIYPYVIIQNGNIINAEDMFEIWQTLHVDVTRVNRGAPKEIRLFSKTVEECGSRMAKGDLNDLKKLLKNDK